MKVVSKWGALVLALFTLVGCDHATKSGAKAALEHQPPIQIISSLLQLRYVENTDAAFNLLYWIPESVRAPLLTGIGVLAVLGLSAVIISRAFKGLERTAFVLVLAGALGNSLDRVFRGYVVDFIHVSHWPVFNVADMLVTFGVAALFWLNVRQHSEPAATLRQG